MNSDMYYQGNLHKCLYPIMTQGISYGTGPKNHRKKGLVLCEILERSSARNGLIVHIVVALRPSRSIVFTAREQLPFWIPHNKHLHLLASTKFLLANHIPSVRRLNFRRIRHSCVLKLFCKPASHCCLGAAVDGG